MKPVYTFATVAGHEADCVAVTYESYPAEPDVGISAGIEIMSVVEEDTCLMYMMTDDEIEELEERIMADIASGAECHADYLRSDPARSYEISQRHAEFCVKRGLT